MSVKSNPALEKYAELMIEKIKNLESGNWSKPWISADINNTPCNINGRQYNSFNRLLLYLVCEKEAYKTPVFITFKKAQDLNVCIRRGEKSSPVFFYDYVVYDKSNNKKVSSEFYQSLSKEDKANYKQVPIFKYYSVFNLDQTNYAELYPEKYNDIINSRKPQLLDIKDRYKNNVLDKIINENKWICPINLVQQDNAYYVPSSNHIILPLREQFPNQKEFYYTALHEMAHSTGHPDCLNRKFGRKWSCEYAREELIAELTSAMVGKDIGMDMTPRKENALYIKSWLEELGGNPQYIYNIITDVKKAADLIEEKIVNKENKIENMQKNEIIGKISYFGPNGRIAEIRDFTNEKDYIKAIAEELYYNPNGFQWKTITDNPETKLKVQNLVKDFSGLEEMEDAKITVSKEITAQYPVLEDALRPHMGHIDRIIPINSKYTLSNLTIASSGNKTLKGSITIEKKLDSINLSLTEKRIVDELTQKSEPLLCDMDLRKMTKENLQSLLSGGKVKMGDDNGKSPQLCSLKKTVSGWCIQVCRQMFNESDGCAGL